MMAMSKLLPLEPEDIAPEMQQVHKDAMLDLVLTWASLDGALSQLLARMLNLSLLEGAELIGKISGSAKLEYVRQKLLTVPEGKEAAQKIKRYKKRYEKYSKIRNRIAHAHCAGVHNKDPRYLVFQVFEKVDDDNLAVELIPLDEMRAATVWGQELCALALRLADT